MLLVIYSPAVRIGKLATRNLAKKNVEISKLVLEIIRIKSMMSYNDENFGSNALDTFLGMAIYIGQQEQRPMSVSKLSIYAGIPRPTVIRRLKALEGYYRIAQHRFMTPTVFDGIEACARAIHRASATLSKLDSEALARKNGNQ
jgi:hypothetical protein